jgi:hypothetical protein
LFSPGGFFTSLAAARQWRARKADNLKRKSDKCAFAVTERWVRCGLMNPPCSGSMARSFLQSGVYVDF